MSHVRVAKFEDIESLLALEMICWAEHLRTSKIEFSQRLEQFPEGQLVLVNSEGEVVGSLQTRRFHESNQFQCTFAKNDLSHENNGNYLQLIQIAVNKTKAPTNAGDMLRRHIIAKVNKMWIDIDKVVAVTRCQQFLSQRFNNLFDLVRNDGSTPYLLANQNEQVLAAEIMSSDNAMVAAKQVYSQYVTNEADPTIFFHLSGGAKIIGIVDDYRQEDFVNLGFGVLVEYNIGDEHETKIQHFSSNNQRSIPANAKDTDEIHSGFNNDPVVSLRLKDCNERSAFTTTILQKVKDIVATNAPIIKIRISESCPLLEILDSLQLLYLHNWICSELESASIPHDLLFRYPSVTSLVSDFLMPNLEDSMTNSNSFHSSFSNFDTDNVDSSINIIGVGMKLPGNINCLQQLDEAMRCKKTFASTIPKSRWFSQLVTEGSPESYGCFLDKESYFDPDFFGMSIQEAQNLDPHFRLLLEVVARAILDSGMSFENLKGSNIGVWIAASSSDFSEIPGNGYKNNNSVYSATGSALSTAAGRVSYVFGLEGPSMVVDTACSSSLVAIDLASTALRENNCDIAIVAGVNLILTPWISASYSRAGMLSKVGQTSAFDNRADGYCRGEGAVSLILAPSSRKIEANLLSYGKIRCSHVKHSGRTANLTSPSPSVQEKLLRECLRKGKLSPNTISAIEAHGTGTKLGDPVEVSALMNVFGPIYHTNSRNSIEEKEIIKPLHLHSVKSVIGHLEAAAGLGGILAAICMVISKRFYGQASYDCMNESISTIVEHCRENSRPFVIPKESTDITLSSSTPICIGVSSFGYSGTIGHVIIEEDSRTVGFQPSIAPEHFQRNLRNFEEFEASYHSLDFPYIDGQTANSLSQEYFASRKKVSNVDSSTHVESDFAWSDCYKQQLLDHVVMTDNAVLPGACMLDAVFRTALPDIENVDNAIVEFSTIKFLQSLHLKRALLTGLTDATSENENINNKSKIVFQDKEDGSLSVLITSGNTNGKVVHFQGQYLARSRSSKDFSCLTPAVDAALSIIAFAKAHCDDNVQTNYNWMQRNPTEIYDAQLYDEFNNRGLKFGNLFQVVKRTHIGFRRDLLHEKLMESCESPQRNDLPPMYAVATIVNARASQTPKSESVGSENMKFMISTEMLDAVFQVSASMIFSLQQKSDFLSISRNKAVKTIEESSKENFQFILTSEICKSSVFIPVEIDNITYYCLGNGTNGNCILENKLNVLCSEANILLAKDTSNIDISECHIVSRVREWGKTFVKFNCLLIRWQYVHSSKRVVHVVEMAGLKMQFVQANRLFKQQIANFSQKNSISLTHIGKCCSWCQGSNVIESNDKLLSALLPSIESRDYFQAITLAEGKRGRLDYLLLSKIHKSELRGAFNNTEGLEIAVTHLSLNFRDVLNTLNLYPGDPGTPGCEFAGVVTKIGNQVTKFSVGDRVMGFREGCFAELITVTEHDVVRVPKNMCLSVASTIPVVYATVFHALKEIANLSKDDVILIHSASGGIGQAAIAYAVSVGAVIVATTSDEKRSQFNGIAAFVGSSRDPVLFERDIQDAVKLIGKRPKVVLNTLGEQFRDVSINAMDSGGYFIELGKRYVLSQEDFSRMRGDCHYATIAIDEFSGQQKFLYLNLLEKICEYESMTNWIAPKITLYSFSDYMEAFTSLRSGQNSGKIVLVSPSAALLINPLDHVYQNDSKKQTLQKSTVKVSSSQSDLEMLLECVARVVPSFGQERTVGNKFGSPAIENRDIMEINLFDQGLDSLGATELVSILSSKFAIDLPATFLFGHSTVREILHEIGVFLKQNPSEEVAILKSKQSLSEVAPKISQEVAGFQNDLIAVTGVSVQFPNGINSLDDFYQNLYFPNSYHDPVSNCALQVDEEILENLGMSYLEVSHMDIRQKLATIHAFKALRDSQLAASSFSPQPMVGVFVGSLGQLSNFDPLRDDNKPAISPGNLSAFSATSRSMSVLAGRISYLLGLNGPSISIDTACSSSLAALHLARRSVQLKECSAAVVVGVNVLDNFLSQAFHVAGMLSPDGQCHTFDESANGYCRGEGCGAVVLKRLSDAERDGDKIYAVIKGSAVMQDGKSASLTAPNGLAQEQLLRAALADAKLSAEDVSYIEAHGTGTKLGDPIEVESIAKVYGANRSAENPLYVSSVKANIGHLEAAAGMAGFVAAMLVASSRQVYPNKELKKLNKYVADAINRNHMNGLVRFPTMHPEQIRFASTNVSLDVHCAVHSFGYSGTISSIVMCQGNVFWGNRLLRENFSEIETVSWPMSSLSGTDYLTSDTDEQKVPMQEEEEAESVTEKDIAQLDFHEIADIVSKIILESIGGTLSRMLDSESTVHPSDENNSAKLLSRLEKENEDLANYGMDSVLATDLSIIINNRLQTNLTAGIILEAKSVRNIIASVMDELNIANTIFAKAASISTGFLFRQCPWFANYLPAQPQKEIQLSSDSENSLVCRIVVFSGMAQPVASWHKFVQPWVTQYNFSVHLVRLPGRYERFLETPLIEIDAIAEEVCKTIEEFGWLRPVNNANRIEVMEEDWVEYSMQQPTHKLVVLGYSSGCAIAYECVRMLQHSFAMPPDRLHLVCLNGPDRQVFGRWEFLPYTSRSLEDFVAYHIKSFGRMNPHFDLKAAYVSTLLDVIFEVFHRDNATSMSWMTEFDNRPLDQRMISCPITAVIGDEDIAVRCCGWKEIGSGKYDQFTYPGDHFFVYHDADLDLEVASDIARSILRATKFAKREYKIK